MKICNVPCHAYMLLQRNGLFEDADYTPYFFKSKTTRDEVLEWMQQSRATAWRHNILCAASFSASEFSFVIALICANFSNVYGGNVSRQIWDDLRGVFETWQWWSKPKRQKTKRELNQLMEWWSLHEDTTSPALQVSLSQRFLLSLFLRVRDFFCNCTNFGRSFGV